MRSRRATFEIKPQSSVLSEDKAWLLGHLAGDGGFVDKGNKHSVTVYAGLDREIAALCARLFLEIYGAKATIRERGPGGGKRKNVSFETVCSWIAVVRDLKAYAPFGLMTWRVPEAILRGSQRNQGAWLSGMFDADGCMYYRPDRYVRVVSLTSINEEGLKQVSSLLDGLGIRHGWSRRKHDNTEWSESHTLYLTFHGDLKAFSRLVGFRATRKQEKLEEALSSYERLVLRTQDVVKHLPEVRRRREAGETHASIAKSLGLVREVVADLCYRNDVEPIGREGNADGGRRSIGICREEGKLEEVLILKNQDTPLREIAEQLEFRDKKQGVQSLLQRAAKKGLIERFARGTKLEDLLPTVVSMRRDGKKWKEIGRALGHQGSDQEAAVYAMGIAEWAKRKGLWPAGLSQPKGVKILEQIKLIAAMRAQGALLKEIGKALGLKGDDQRLATSVTNIIGRAKKKGLWPLPIPPLAPIPAPVLR